MMKVYSYSMNADPRLWPREHGAYAQLAFPLVTGLALAPPSAASLALGAAAVLLFLVNEPVAILLGVRGMRVQEQLGPLARRRAGRVLVAGGVLGGSGLVLGWPALWPEVMVPLLAGLLLVPLALAGRQKSLSGEMLVLTAFSTLVLPLAAASGADPLRALAAAGVWWLSFFLGTLEVHAIKARVKKSYRYGWTRWGSPLAAALAVAGALYTALGQVSPVLRSLGGAMADGSGPGADWGWILELNPYLAPGAAALLPPALAILILSLIRVHPRHLKRVGWTLVGANTLTLLLLLQG
jgi:hypothetical protein